MRRLLLITAVLVLFIQISYSQESLKILNFQADNGFQHDSKDEALDMIEWLGSINGWEVITSIDTSTITSEFLETIDVIVFNNNCGTAGRIFSDKQHAALQKYIRNGGGFVGIHCAGAIWKEEGEFQEWYEKLIGTRLVAHPHVQEAKLIVENQCHICTAHLPKEWIVNDEWHKFSFNPRENVNVLISLDENSYEGNENQKMGGDHPFTWYQYYDGGRSFFTSLGHTEKVFKDDNYQKLVEGGILWAAGIENKNGLDVTNGLILDLDADKGVVTEEDNRVVKWTNQVGNFIAKDFVSKDYGVRLANPGSGRPLLKKNLNELNGHNTLVFIEDELINDKEDAFDNLITGSGYTWFAIIKPYETQKGVTEFGQGRLTDINAFMGNLKNYWQFEGIWGAFNDDLTVWCGSRNSVTFDRGDSNNPKVLGPKLEPDKYYIVASRLGSGRDTVNLEIFVDDDKAYASKPYPVCATANSSKLAIGTERDATNHPGAESFEGELARFLIFERPLSDAEFSSVIKHLKMKYKL